MEQERRDHEIALRLAAETGGLNIIYNISRWRRREGIMR